MPDGSVLVEVEVAAVPVEFHELLSVGNPQALPGENRNAATMQEGAVMIRTKLYFLSFGCGQDSIVVPVHAYY